MMPPSNGHAPHTDFDTIADALGCSNPHCDCHKRRGNSCTVHCPAHADESPSLKLDYKDGAVLWHCFTGCAQDAVMEALKERGLIGINGSTPNKAAWLTVAQATEKLSRDRYLSTDTLKFFQVVTLERGQHWRYPASGAQRCKHFDSKHKPKYWWEPEMPRPVKWYNLENVPQSAERVYVVNGEPAVWACYQAGVPAICKLSGENDNFCPSPDALKSHGIKQVDIVFDLDDAGIKGADKLYHILHKAGLTVQVHKLPDILGTTGDVADLYKLHKGNNESFKQALETLEIREAKEISASANGHILSATSLIAKEFEPIKWAVPGLIPEGINMLAGRPKLGKSWMALGIAIAIGSGGYVLGQIKVEQGSVLYLGLEDSFRRLKERLIKMLDGASPPEKLDLSTECPRVGEGGIEYIESWLQDHNDARMVVVDTYIKVRQPRKANADIYDADYQAINAYKAISERYKVAILLIHHLRKASADDPFDAILGTTGVGGSIDAGLVLQRERGKADAVLSVAGRDTEEKKVALRWDADLAQWVMLGDAEEFRMNVLKQAILNTIRRAGDSSPKEVADSIGDSIPGANANSIRQHMHQMGKNGILKVTERGRYTILLSKTPDNPDALDEALESLKGIGGDTWKEPF